MKNQEVGYLLLGVTALVLILNWSYNNALNNIVNTSCSHGLTCPMYQTIRTQNTFSYILISLLVITSAYLVFNEQITKNLFLKKAKLALSKEEKKIYNLLLENNLRVPQVKLREELKLSKVKTTRLLNRLEKKGLIERKRQGIGNIVVLKMKLVS